MGQKAHSRSQDRFTTRGQDSDGRAAGYTRKARAAYRAAEQSRAAGRVYDAAMHCERAARYEALAAAEERYCDDEGDGAGYRDEDLAGCAAYTAAPKGWC